jgi:hypothetical protein
LFHSLFYVVIVISSLLQRLFAYKEVAVTLVLKTDEVFSSHSILYFSFNHRQPSHHNSSAVIHTVMTKRPPITFDLDDGAYSKRAKLDLPKKKIVEDDDDLLADYEEVKSETKPVKVTFLFYFSC